MAYEHYMNPVYDMHYGAQEQLLAASDVMADMPSGRYDFEAGSARLEYLLYHYDEQANDHRDIAIDLLEKSIMGDNLTSSKIRKQALFGSTSSRTIDITDSTVSLTDSQKMHNS